MDSNKLPVELPAGWTAEHAQGYGTIITAVDAAGAQVGFVTVAEDLRAYSLGMCRPRRLDADALPSGRGWKKQLYEAAIAKLTEAIS